jgi:hypothetical protein
VKRTNFDSTVNRWFDCVARGSHRFNQAGICMDCTVPQRGPTVVIRSGGTPRSSMTK